MRVVRAPLLCPRAVGSQARGPLWGRSGANTQKGTWREMGLGHRSSLSPVPGYFPFGPGAEVSTRLTSSSRFAHNRVLFQKPRVPLSAELTPFRGKSACEPKSHFGVAFKTREGKGDKQTPESHQGFVTS